MAEIQFERRGLPLWKVVLGLLAAGAVAVGGYEVVQRESQPTVRPAPPAGAQPSPRPTTTTAP